MFISDTAIKRPVLTVVAMMMLVVFGIVALFQLDTDEYPEIDAPVVVVAIPYPGASPDVVEREVIDPIEEEISGISGIDRMRSNSFDSFANIIIEFDYSKDPRVATQEVRDKISGIRNDLPTEMEEPILTQFDPADRPILSLALSSPGLTGAELTRIADPGITRKLRGITGVATVNLSGDIERELVVEIRPRDLQAAGVSVGQVVQALQSQNLASPVGRLEGQLDERTIRLKGRLDSPADFKQLTVSQSQGRIVRLGDLADVRDATEEARSSAHYNDEVAVGIDILKSAGFSTTAVGDEIRERIAELQQTLPAGVTLRIVQDAGVRVEDSVFSVQEALIEGAALTVAVVFLFLNSWRSTIITGLALPGVGAGVVRRGVGVRLHAEHDVAARPVAGHRHPHRRCDRGEREHRAPRGDGEGPSQGGLRGNRRDRPGGHRDHVVDRRGVHPDCVSGRRGGAMVQAVRPHHRLVGAGVAVRVVLPRPDALGVLARSAQAARAAAVAVAPPGPIQSLVRSPGGGLQERDRLGARSSGVDGDAGDCELRRRARASGRWASSAPDSCRRWTCPRFRSISRRLPARTSNTRG